MMIFLDTVATGVIVGVIVAVVSAIANRKVIKGIETRQAKEEEETKRAEAVAEGVYSLLHNRLYSSLERAYFRGVVGYDEFENLATLYKPYRDLNGNGTIERRFNQVNALKRVHDEELSKYDKEADIHEN